MKHKKLTCPDKLEALLDSILSGPGITITVNTLKESSCSTPQVDSVEFRKGDQFAIIGGYSGLYALVKPTPKLVKRVMISGKLAGWPVSELFKPGDYTEDFTSTLTDVVKEEIEVEDAEAN